ncbi:MAG: hypothetical protein ABIH63_02745 [archaeon]
MVFGFFKKRDDAAHEKIGDLNKKLGFSFTNLKKDMDAVNVWITHFTEKHEKHEDRFENLHKRLDKIEGDMEEIKGVWTRVQTRVQTGVQTRVQRTDVRLKQMSVQTNTLEKLKNLSVMERGLIWILLNSDAKMSYEDLCMILGKNKSTLRGQITNIKLKSPDLVKEVVENDGTKRFYVEEKVKEEILKKPKKVEVQAKKRVKK